MISIMAVLKFKTVNFDQLLINGTILTVFIGHRQMNIIWLIGWMIEKLSSALKHVALTSLLSSLY